MAKWVAWFATDRETADPDDAKNRTVAEVLLKNPNTAAPIIADIVGTPEFTENPESRGRVAGCVISLMLGESNNTGAGGLDCLVGLLGVQAMRSVLEGLGRDRKLEVAGIAIACASALPLQNMRCILEALILDSDQWTGLIGLAVAAEAGRSGRSAEGQQEHRALRAVLEANRAAACAANYTLVASALIAAEASAARDAEQHVRVFLEIYADMLDQTQGSAGVLVRALCDMCTGTTAVAASEFLTEFLLGYGQSDPRAAVESLVRARAADAVERVLLGMAVRGDGLASHALCVALKAGAGDVLSTVMPIAAREGAGNPEYINSAVARAVADFVAGGNDLKLLFELMDQSFGERTGAPRQLCCFYELCAPAVRHENWGAVRELLARGLVMPCIGTGQQETSARANQIVGNMASLFSAARPPTGDTLELVLEVLSVVHERAAAQPVVGHMGLSRTEVLGRLSVVQGLLACQDQGVSKALFQRMVTKYGYSAYDLAVAPSFIRRAVELHYYDLIELLVSRLAEEGKVCDALCGAETASEPLLMYAPERVLVAMFEKAAPEIESGLGNARKVLASLLDTRRVMDEAGGVSVQNKENFEAIVKQQERRAYFYGNPWVAGIRAVAPRLAKDRLWLLLERSARRASTDTLTETIGRVYDTSHEALLATAVRDKRITELLVRSPECPPRATLLRAWVRHTRYALPDHTARGHIHADGPVFIDRGLIKAALDGGDARASKELEAQLEGLAAFMVASCGSLGAFAPADMTGMFGVSIDDSVGGDRDAAATTTTTTRRIRDTACGSGAEYDALTTLVRACMATGGFDRRHPTGAIPTSAASTEVMQLLGYAIGKLVMRGATTGPCISTPLLAHALGCTTPSIAEWLLGTVSPVGTDILDALSLFGGLTEEFTDRNVERIKSAVGGGTVTTENLACFLSEVERIAMRWDRLGRPMQHITNGFLGSIGPETLVLGDKFMAPLACILSGPDATNGLIVGAVTIDAAELAALRGSVEYQSGLSNDHRVVQWLWSIVGRMSQESLVLFLRFWTSKNPPPGGFRGVRRETYIVCAAEQAGGHGGPSGPSAMVLPTASTCFNALNISVAYPSEEQMERALYYAIQNTDTGMHEGWGGIVAQ